MASVQLNEPVGFRCPPSQVGSCSGWRQVRGGEMGSGWNGKEMGWERGQIGAGKRAGLVADVSTENNSPFRVSIHLHRSTWICTSDISGTGLSRPTGKLTASCLALELISLSIQAASSQLCSIISLNAYSNL